VRNKVNYVDLQQCTVIRYIYIYIYIGNILFPDGSVGPYTFIASYGGGVGGRDVRSRDMVSVSRPKFEISCLGLVLIVSCLEAFRDLSTVHSSAVKSVAFAYIMIR